MTPISDLIGAGYANAGQTLVAVQSVSLGKLTQRYLPGLNNFEDRNFYLGEFIRCEGNHAVFVVSNDPDEVFVAYQLKSLAQSIGVQVEEVAEKISILRILNDDARPLSQILVEDTEQFDRLCEIIRPLPNPILDFWAVSELELELAGRLNLPYLGPLSESIGLDDKSSSRKIFYESKIVHPIGTEDIYSFDEAINSVRVLSTLSDASKFLIKLNDEEAGNGIAVVTTDIVNLPANVFRSAIKISKDIPLAEFEARLAEGGGVVEELVDRKYVANPSVKMYISRDGEVVNLATHDQMLTNLSYSGCVFPADAAYRANLIRLGYRVAEALVVKGVRGVFSVDFLAGRNSEVEDWSLWALEINIRKGATTHPYFWTRLLANAEYFEDTGVLRDESGELVYLTSEYVHAEGLSNCTTSQIIDAIRNAGIEYTKEKRSGVFFHMGSCVKKYSKFGVTVIATSQGEADDLLKTLQGITLQLSAVKLN